MRFAVPFLSGYKTFWTSLGIVAFWALAFLGLSYYARARIGVQRWRKLHRFTALAWIFGLAHSLGDGTDAGQAWFLVMCGVVVIPALLLLAMVPMAHAHTRPHYGGTLRVETLADAWQAEPAVASEREEETADYLAAMA